MVSCCFTLSLFIVKLVFVFFVKKDIFRDKELRYKHSKTITVDNSPIPLQIYDIEPSTPVPKIAECIEKSKAIILVFSTVDHYSFEKLKSYIQDIQALKTKNFKNMFVFVFSFF